MENLKALRNVIAVISCSEPSSDKIIANIVGSECVPENITENIKSYAWHIETKYYSADVNFISIERKEIPILELANQIEAVLIHFDCNKIQSFKEAQSWLPVVESLNVPVTLLICSNNIQDDSDVKRGDALDWCLKNQLELVELAPCEENDDSEVDDDFQETKGYQRIVQALHAHTWSDMDLKDPPVYQPSEEVISSLKEDSYKLGLTPHGAVADNGLPNGSIEGLCIGNIPNGTSSKIDKLFEEDKWLFENVGQEDPDGESFETMFSRILTLKEKATTLVGEERKLYAEKVAIEFWKAIGGDEEEISGLSSDDN